MNPDEMVKDGTGLKVSMEDLTPARKSLSVEVPAEQVAAEYDQSCRTYARSLKVPGFRQGKVPHHIIKQRFGREIRQETVERVIEKAIREALDGAGVSPLRAPVLKDYAYTPGEPLSFTAEFEVKPVVKPNGLDKIDVKMAEPAVTDRMISEALDSLRERAARFDPVEGRGVQTGDHVIMDIRATFAPGEGEDFSRENLMLEVGSGGPHPELTEHLRDMKPGETRDFSVSYAADHQAKDVAGKRVGYSTVVREVKEKVLPDLDDEFARDLGKFENLEDLKKRVTEDLTRQERRRARGEAHSRVIEQLLTSNPDVTLPEVLVDEEVDRRVDELVRGMILQGMDPRDQAVDWEKIRERQREPAEKAVRAMILLDAAAAEMDISVQDGDLDHALSEEAARRRQTPEALRAKFTKDGRLERMREHIAREKVLDFLLGESNT